MQWLQARLSLRGEGARHAEKKNATMRTRPGSQVRSENGLFCHLTWHCGAPVGGGEVRKAACCAARGCAEGIITPADTSTAGSSFTAGTHLKISRAGGKVKGPRRHARPIHHWNKLIGLLRQIICRVRIIWRLIGQPPCRCQPQYQHEGSRHATRKEIRRYPPPPRLRQRQAGQVARGVFRPGPGGRSQVRWET